MVKNLKFYSIEKLIFFYKIRVFHRNFIVRKQTRRRKLTGFASFKSHEFGYKNNKTLKKL